MDAKQDQKAEMTKLKSFWIEWNIYIIAVAN